MPSLRLGVLQGTRRSDLLRIVLATAALGLVLGSVLALDAAVPSEGTLRAGDIATRTLRAPRATTFTSALQTAEARQAARDAVPPQYDYTTDRAAAIAAEQAVYLERGVAPVDAAFAATATEKDPKAAKRTRDELLGVVLPGLSDAARKTLLSLSEARWSAVRAEAARVLDGIERAELRDTDVAAARGDLAGRMVEKLSEDEARLASEIVAPLVVPNSAYSEALTAEARETAARLVAPVLVSLQQNEVIVDAGHAVGPSELEKIDALGLDENRLDPARVAGLFLGALLLVGLLFGWLARFRPTFWHRNNVLLLIGLALTFAVLVLKVTVGRQTLPFFVPTATVGILLAILLDATTATVATAMLAILAGIVTGGSLEMSSYVLLGGIAGIVAVRRGDRFERFLVAGFAIAVIGGLTITTFSLLGTRDLTGILQLWVASAGAGGGAAVAALGSFHVLGNLFGILTAFQLLELANPTQPLLRRLLVETPGTYHHSLMVGNLAERAAETIGADPLLTRVAAYYHDVGKLVNPLAFIENQAGAENVHETLTPDASAQILKSHVAAGIDVAYEAHLPKPIIAFIPQHHGTALMAFFYAKAREEAAAPFGGLETPEGARAADAVDPRRFRHAGPRPQSREAALIMLADGVEASVRSLVARDEPAIRAMVNRIIEERVSDGQFDECDLTLRDIELIREAFVTQLQGVYHQRVPYPQNKIVELESRREAS